MLKQSSSEEKKENDECFASSTFGICCCSPLFPPLSPSHDVCSFLTNFHLLLLRDWNFIYPRTFSLHSYFSFRLSPLSSPHLSHFSIFVSMVSFPSLLVSFFFSSVEFYFSFILNLFAMFIIHAPKDDTFIHYVLTYDVVCDLEMREHAGMPSKMMMKDSHRRLLSLIRLIRMITKNMLKPNRPRRKKHRGMKMWKFFTPFFDATERREHIFMDENFISPFVVNEILTLHPFFLRSQRFTKYHHCLPRYSLQSLRCCCCWSVKQQKKGCNGLQSKEESQITESKAYKAHNSQISLRCQKSSKPSTSIFAILAPSS